jgi:probable phosphoglycerate mutase
MRETDAVPGESTELIIVRHGETAWNVECRIQGQLHVDLNERGRMQARAAALALADEVFEALYSSDLRRALQTADAIAGTTGKTIATDPRLREWSLGILEGLSSDEAEAKFPDVYNAFRVEDPDYLIPEGESIRQRYERSTEAVSEIAGRHPGERVVIVTHGGVLDDLYRRTKGLALDSRKDFKIYNGGINRLEVTGDRWEIVSWGDIGHLEEIGSLGEW